MLCTHCLFLTACGQAPTVNLDCSDKGKAIIWWQNDCDESDCGMTLSCTDSTGSTDDIKVYTFYSTILHRLCVVPFVRVK